MSKTESMIAILVVSVLSASVLAFALFFGYGDILGGLNGDNVFVDGSMQVESVPMTPLEVALLKEVVQRSPTEKALVLEALESEPFVPTDGWTEKRCVAKDCQAKFYSGDPGFVLVAGAFKDVTEVVTLVIDPDFNVMIDDTESDNDIAFKSVLKKGGQRTDYSDFAKKSDIALSKSQSDLKSAHKFGIGYTKTADFDEFVWETSDPVTIDNSNKVVRRGSTKVSFYDLVEGLFTVDISQSGGVTSVVVGNLSFKDYLDPMVTIGNETGANPLVNDTWANSAEVGTNYGTGLFMEARLHTGAAADGKPHVKVNFSSLGAISAIANATLYLTEDDTQALQAEAVINAFNVTPQGAVNNFGEYSMTWDTQPCGTSDNSMNASCNSTANVTILAPGGNDGTYGFGVTAAAQSVMSSTQTLLIAFQTLSDPANEVRFESKESAAAQRFHPFLYLDYTAVVVPVQYPNFTSNRTYQGGGSLATSSATNGPYTYNQTEIGGNISIEAIIQPGNATTGIDTVTITFGGAVAIAEYTNKAALNGLRVYNTTPTYFFLNFTPPSAAPSPTHYWAIISANNTNGIVNSTGNFSISIDREASYNNLFSPATNSITYNASITETCSSDSTDTTTLSNFYRNGVLKTAFGSGFINGGGANQYSCDSVTTQNYSSRSTNGTLTVNNATLPVANLRKFIDGLPRNATGFDTQNFTVSANGTTVAGFENVTWNLYVGNRLTTAGTTPSATIWLAPGIQQVSFNSSGGQNYSSGGNNSIYINVSGSFGPAVGIYNTPVIETNWTLFNLTVYINDTTGSVRNVTAYLFWNSTNQSFDAMTNSSNVLTFRKNVTVPLMLPVNGTGVPSNWTYNVMYANGTTLAGNTSYQNQSVTHAYTSVSLSMTTVGAYGVLEGTNLTANVTLVATFNSSTVSPTLYYNANGGTDSQSVPARLNYSFWNGWLNVSSPPGPLNASQWVNASVNVTFQGNTRLLNASQTFTADRLFVGQCNGTFATTAMGIVSMHESNRTNVSATTANFTVNADLEAYLGGQSRSYPVALNGSTAYYLCIFPSWAGFQLNATMQYLASPTFADRSYFLELINLTNTSQNLELFLIPAVDADLASFTARDSQSNLVPNAIVQVRRYYPEIDSFRTVQVVRTNAEGVAPAYVTLSDVFYSFRVYKDGVLKFTSDPALIPTSAIELLIGGVAKAEYVQYINDVTNSCDFDNTTRRVTCTWLDSGGHLTQGCLKVTRLSPLRLTELSDACTQASGGTLTYDIPADSNTYSYFFYGTFDFNPISQITFESVVIDAPFTQPFGTSGLFIMLFVFLSMIGIGLKDPRIAIVISIFVLVVGFVLQFFAIGAAALAGLIGVAIVALWRMRTVG